MRKNSLPFSNSPEGRMRQLSPRRRMYNLSRQRQMLEDMYRDKFQESIYMKSKISLLQKSLLAAKELNLKYQQEIQNYKGNISVYMQQIQKLYHQIDQFKRGNQILSKTLQDKEKQFNFELQELQRQFNQTQFLRNQELKQIQLEFVRNQIALNQKIKLAEKQNQRLRNLKLGQFSSYRHQSKIIEQYRNIRIPDPNSDSVLTDIQKMLRQVSQMQQNQLSIHLQKGDLLQKIQQKLNRFQINFLNRGQVINLPLTSSMNTDRKIY